MLTRPDGGQAASRAQGQSRIVSRIAPHVTPPITDSRLARLAVLPAMASEVPGTELAREDTARQLPKERNV
jgi:hypothetical protein